MPKHRREAYIQEVDKVFLPLVSQAIFLPKYAKVAKEWLTFARNRLEGTLE
jgi:hypothetical protein